MANTNRREDYIDRNGNMFIPMNVEGGTWNEHFITTPKLMAIACVFIALLLICSLLASEGASVTAYILFIAIWLIVSIYVFRFIVFEEKFYYRMYKELEKHEISSPALFWDIASIKDTDEGAIITYSDARIGILVKIDRDTITGKPPEFRETHYDAISDFYREVNVLRYSFVQMNIMEQAGKDPRLNELNKLVYKDSNKNIQKLMEMQVGHIKNITHKALYESDYFLFYTDDLSKMDVIVQDISECIFKLLDGAYVSYQVLNSGGVVDLVKELYGVNYFNSTQASLLMFNTEYQGIQSPFIIRGILWDDEENQELSNSEVTRLRNITSGILKGTLDKNKVSLKDTLYRKDIKNKVGIDFDLLAGDSIEIKKQHQNKDNVNLTKEQNLKVEQDDDEEFIDI